MDLLLAVKAANWDLKWVIGKLARPIQRIRRQSRRQRARAARQRTTDV